MADLYRETGLTPTGESRGTDLYEASGVTPSWDPTVGQRFGQNIERAFEDYSLLGSSLVEHKLGGVHGRKASQQRLALEIADALDLDMAPSPGQVREFFDQKLQATDSAGPGMALAYHTGNTDAFVPDDRAWLDAVSGMDLPEVRRREQADQAESERLREQNLPGHLEELKRYEAMAPWYQEEGGLNKALSGVSALTAQLLGANASPEILFSPGRAATIPGTIAKQGSVNAAVNALTNVGIQEQQQRTGLRDEFDATDVAIDATLGFLFPAGIEGGRVLLRRTLGKLRGKAPESLTPDDIADLSESDVAAIVRDVEEQLGRPTDYRAATEQATGVDRAAPRPASRAEQVAQTKARNKERAEIADAFRYQDEVLPRRAMGDDGSVPEGTAPVTDRTGAAPTPEQLAVRRQAHARLSQYLGREPEPAELRAAEAMLEVGETPDAVARSFRRAERSAEFRDVPAERDLTARRNTDSLAREAFDVAEARRARRESDLETGQSATGDYRAGAIPPEQNPPREFHYLDARRENGELIGEPVRILARRMGPDADGQYTVPEVRVAYGKDLDATEWVDASRITRLEQPSSPRQAQAFAEEAHTRPRGTGTTDPGPSQAVDRQSSRTVTREPPLEGDVMPRADGEPGGPVTDPTGRVYDGETATFDEARALEGPRAPETEASPSPPTRSPAEDPGSGRQAVPDQQADSPRATDDPEDSAPSALEKAAEISPGGRGGTLHSNPIGEVAKFAAQLWKGDADSWRVELESKKSLLNDLRAVARLRAKDRPSKRSVMTDTWRRVLASTDGNLRTLVGKFDSPTLKALPDLFHAKAGQGRGVGATLDERMSSRANRRMKDVEALLDEVQRSGAKQAQLVRLLENPDTRRAGALGRAADKIERFFKDELQYLKDAGIDVGEVKGYFPRMFDQDAVIGKKRDFIKAATAAYKAQARAGKFEGAPEEAAEALWEGIAHGDVGRPGGAGGGGAAKPSFLKSREFTKEAADILDQAGFYTRDLDQVLTGYVMRATKRAEVARTAVRTGDGREIAFGDNFKNWRDVVSAIKAEDPDAGSILGELEHLVAVSAGVAERGRLADSMRGTSSWIRTWTTLALLEKAALTSMGELVLAPMRGVTGDVPGDMAQIVGNLGKHTINALRASGRVVGHKNKSLANAFELAEDLGIIAGQGHQSLMAARFTGGDPAGRAQSKFINDFFRRNMLEQLTNYTRVTSMQQGQVFLRRLAKQLDQGKGRAAFFLRELGVPKGQEAGFAKWLAGFDKQLPTGKELAAAGRWGEVYRTATQRFVDQTVMRPSSVTRPGWANHPLGAVLFQLQSFNYAFQKNVLNRYGNLIKSAWKGNEMGLLDGMGFTLSTVGTIPILLTTQYLVGEARDAMFAEEGDRGYTPLAKAERAWSRSGLSGVMDPLIQMMSGVRYQRGVVESFVGPAIGSISSAADAMLRAGLNNSEKTNKAERRLVKELHGYLVEPLGNLALSTIPGSGPLAQMAKSGATIYGLPKTQAPMVDALAGEEENRRARGPRTGFLEDMFGEEDPSTLQRGSRSSSRGQSRSSDRGR